MANVIKGYILKDGLDVGGSANVAGALKVDGATTLAAVTSTNITSSGIINVASTANVGGATALRGTLTVNGSTIVANTLQVGNTSITGFVNVSSSANIAGTLQVAGATSFTNILGVGNTTVTGFINVSSTANVGGATTLRSTLDVTGATAITNILGAGNTTVTGFANVTSTLQVGGVGTFGAGMAVAGNLGVGTTGPSTKLHVSGTGEQELRVSTLTSGNPIISVRAEGVNGGSIIYNRASALLQLDNGGGGGINITTGGNVGVGVVPTYKLDVAGVIRSSSGTDGGAHFWGFSSASVSSRTWAFYNDYAAFGDFTLLQSSTQTGNPTTSRMYFDASGNLGLSEASPTSRLHVNGMIQARNGTTGISISGDGTNGYINGVGANPVVFQINSTERMRFDTSGNIILTGNLIVSGTTTYVNTAILNVADNIISLNSDLPSGSAPTENAGIEVNRGSSANTALRWNESIDIWEVTNDGTTYGRIHSKLADVVLGTDTSGNYVATVTNGNGISISGSGVETAAVTVTAVTSNGMALDANGIRALAGNTQLVSNTSGLWVIQSNIDHNSLTNYAANRHVDHSTVSITAGNGLTGGGDITASRTLDVGAANGIVVSADSVGVVAGSGIVVDVSGVSHADTSSVTNLTASGRRYVTGLTFDTYGHVTGYTTGTETVVDTDTNTTYSVKASVQTGGAGLDLDAGGSGSGTDTVKILGSGTTTVTRTDADTITIGSTDLYVGTVTSVSGGAGLTGSFSTSGSLAVGAGVGITVNADDVAVNAQTGLIANTLGLYVDAGTISIGTMPTARLPVGSTAATGIIQLTDSISSTSTTTAATPNSVKSAYDLAATKANAGQTMHIGTTAVAINRASSSLSLTGVSIDGTAGGVAWTNVSGRPTAVSAFTNDSAYITTNGRAYPRRSDGTSIDFIYSGQSGTPSYVWGTGDGVNMYVWSPANFSVNYATTAGGVAWSGVSSVPSASTTGAGIVQLTDSVATTSSTLAATATAVKSAYDLAATKANAGQTMHIGTTAVAINRASASLSLTGVSIDGNAGTVAGLAVHTGTNNEANKIVRTDGNGYIQAGYIHSASGNEAQNSNPPRVWGTNGTDSYLRTYLTSALSVAYATNAGGINATNPLLGYSVSAANISLESQGGPQIQNQGAGAAMMSFHRTGAYAVNFGLGTDNQLRTGGWSRGAASFVILDSGNYTSYAPTLSGSGATGTWAISISGTAAAATLAAKSSTLAAGGGNGDAMTFNWSGQSGQPTWLWGGNDVGNMYVYNPSNFSVNYATSAGGVAWTNVSSRPTALSAFTNDVGFVTSSGVTSVSGTGTVSGITLTGTVSSTGSLTLGGSITAASTSAAGIVQLTDSVGSTSTTTAATPNSVKTAYDLAAGKAATGQTFYIGTTQVAINRGSGSLSLTGVSIDGSAGSVAWTNVSSRPTALSAFTNDTNFVTASVTLTTASQPNITGVGTLGSLSVTGNVTAGDFVISSDDKLKNRIGNVPDALTAVNSLNGFKYTWNDTAVELRNYTTDHTRVGVSAQEVEAILPEAVYTDDDGYKTVSYDSLVPLLIEAVKELSKKVSELEAK